MGFYIILIPVLYLIVIGLAYLKWIDFKLNKIKRPK